MPASAVWAWWVCDYPDVLRCRLVRSRQWTSCATLLWRRAHRQLPGHHDHGAQLRLRAARQAVCGARPSPTSVDPYASALVGAEPVEPADVEDLLDAGSRSLRPQRSRRPTAWPRIFTLAVCPSRVYRRGRRLTPTAGSAPGVPHQRQYPQAGHARSAAAGPEAHIIDEQGDVMLAAAWVSSSCAANRRSSLPDYGACPGPRRALAGTTGEPRLPLRGENHVVR